MTYRYELQADCLWYAGHVLTGIAIVVNHFFFLPAVVIVFVGQSITMLSRPLGRIEAVGDDCPA